MYKDKVEIWNLGNFPEDYNLIDFIENQTPSILRNLVVYNVLYLSEDIEKWSLGLKRIYEECIQNNVKDRLTKRSNLFSNKV
jgi:predicted HTH transcriptional regulator